MEGRVCCTRWSDIWPSPGHSRTPPRGPRGPHCPARGQATPRGRWRVARCGCDHCLAARGHCTRPPPPLAHSVDCCCRSLSGPASSSDWRTTTTMTTNRNRTMMTGTRKVCPHFHCCQTYRLLSRRTQRNWKRMARGWVWPGEAADCPRRCCWPRPLSTSGGRPRCCWPWPRSAS